MVILQELALPPELNLKEAIGEAANQLFDRFAFIVPILKLLGWLLVALIALRIIFIIGRFFREGHIIKLLKNIEEDISQIRNKFVPEAREEKKINKNK